MINFSKYRRFFAFGCSMTGYYWPTWADIISQEISESYNYGKSGAGNIFISSSLAEAHQRYHFNEHDLIMCMWSGVAREDRYVNNYWQTPGNIFTQNYYDEKFIRQYADIRGYILRDMTLISLTVGFLENLNIDYHMLNMMPFNFLQLDRDYDKESNNDIFDLFQDTLKKIKPDLATIELENKWPCRSIYHNPGQTVDYHPSTMQHFQYLQKVFPGTRFSDETIKFIDYYENMIDNAKTISDIKWQISKPVRF
jgi:hypothetical protein